MGTKTLEVRYTGDWNVLPGASASLTRTTEELDDRVFGQAFMSTQPALINWEVSGNAYYKGRPGYVARIFESGDSLEMLDEATESLGDNRFQIADPDKQIIDRTETITVKDDGTEVDSADIELFNYLFGEVKLVESYTPTGDITIDAHYLELEDAGRAQDFTLTQTAETEDITTLRLARENDGHEVHRPNALTVELTIEGFYDVSDGLNQKLRDRAEVVIELNPDGDNESRCRGFFRPVEYSQEGDVGDTESDTTQFNLSVPDDQTLETPFAWRHTEESPLNKGVQDILQAWLDQELPEVRYRPDGEKGYYGEAVVTEASLTGGVNVMNEFSVSFQGSGELFEEEE